MRSFYDVLGQLVLEEGEPVPSHRMPDRQLQYHRLEYSTPLGLGVFGFAWDENYWSYKAYRQNQLTHRDAAYWCVREPDWELLRDELRAITGYVPAKQLSLFDQLKGE